MFERPVALEDVSGPALDALAAAPVGAVLELPLELPPLAHGDGSSRSRRCEPRATAGR